MEKESASKETEDETVEITPVTSKVCQSQKNYMYDDIKYSQESRKEDGEGFVDDESEEESASKDTDEITPVTSKVCQSQEYYMDDDGKYFQESRKAEVQEDERTRMSKVADETLFNMVGALLDETLDEVVDDQVTDDDQDQVS